MADKQETDAASLDRDIASFEEMRAELEKHHIGKWVVIHDAKLVDAFDSFENAAAEAVRRFRSGPYLIRQVGAPPMVMPASVMYRPVSAGN